MVHRASAWVKCVRRIRQRWAIQRRRMRASSRLRNTLHSGPDRLHIAYM
jgi:hypothetical protein